MGTYRLAVGRLRLMEKPTSDRDFDPGMYGRSFAEVYDSWYPADSATDSAVGRISTLAGDNGRVLELGVGTGRLAIPLVALGHRVIGMDASPEMLAALDAKSRAAGTTDLVGVPGDVGDPADWPEGEFEVIVAAFNLIFNLADEATQMSAFGAAAGHLRPGGALVVEAFIPPPHEYSDRPERNLELRSVSPAGVTLIATEMEPGTGVVVGQHIELCDGELPRLRPWRIRVASPADMDRWATRAGLELTERHADWAGSDYSEAGTNHVSVYRRARSA